MRTQSRFELLLALGLDGCHIDIAAHRVDGGRQLGERAHGDDLVPVDGQARSAGRGDSFFNSLESGVALARPSGALRSVLGDLAAAVDVRRELRA